MIIKTQLLLVIPTCMLGVLKMAQQVGDSLIYTDYFLQKIEAPLAATKETFHLCLFYTLAVLALVTLIEEFASSLEKEVDYLQRIIEMYSINILFLFADSAPLVLVTWIVSFVPLYKYARRSYKLAFVSSSLLLGLAVFLIFLEGGLHLSLSKYQVGLNTSLKIQVAGGLVLLAAFIRQGVFPFHLWTRPLVEGAPFALVLPFLVTQNGLYLLYHMAMPLLSHEVRNALPLASILGIFSAIYFAFKGLALKKVRSVFLNIFLCQSMIVMVGVELTDHLSTIGALIQWMNLILAGMGLGLCIILTEARTDVRHYDEAGGIGLVAPKLSWLYFLFGFIMIGLPGALGYIGEDILYHAIVDRYPYLGVSITLATALNGILFYRSFSEIYQGPLISDYEITDLRGRQRWALTIMIFVLFTVGMVPRLLVTDNLFSKLF